MKSRVLIIGLSVVVVVAAVVLLSDKFFPSEWTAEELKSIESLWLGNLTSLPPDPSNAVADDLRAATLGSQIFIDTRFSANGEISCATCHRPEQFFTDGLARAIGLGETPRGAPTIIGTAYSPWLFWDGRKDSQWAQALGPMESAIEHGGTRTQYAHLIDQIYREQYEALFGPMPDISDLGRFPEIAGPVEDEVANQAWENMSANDRQLITRIYANIGKVIAAFERTILPTPSIFDQYVEALLRKDPSATDILTEAQTAGLRLFIGSGRCIECHNTPLFANNDFAGIGTPPTSDLGYDPGRVDGIDQVRIDEFNCLSKYSDAAPDLCTELNFIKERDVQMIGAFKTPTLRNIAETAPYMHAGQFVTLEDVLDHYNEAPTGLRNHTDLTPLNFTDEELDQIIAFLKTLTSSAPTNSTQH
jgi:cytochrome c peroxidase